MIKMTIFLLHILLRYLVLSLYRPVVGIQCHDNERKALLDFKHDIKTDYCDRLANWNPISDCCTWRGVHCSNQTGHVDALHLEGGGPGGSISSCLEGKISPSLIELKYLRHLNLSFNEFDQSIPRFLGSLPNLEHLSLSHVFEGEIPDELGNLSKLTTLEIRMGFSLHVESLHWLSRMRLLRNLYLSGVDLSKVMNWMSIVSNLPFLRALRLGYCQLSVKNPSEGITNGNSSSTLSLIDLSGNSINDSSIILQWLFNFPGINTQLEYLDLSSNSFQGSFPDGLRNFLHLSYLSLSDNHFQGSIVETVSKLCNLEKLDLGGNSFTDELTSVIQGLVNCGNTGLTGLGLSGNRFWGTIPDSINSFSLLRELYLDGNLLKGGISRSIGQLSMLEKLDLSSNSLEGNLTHAHFLNLSRLRELYLSDNSRLVFNIDLNWIPPFQLNIISLRSCKLGPEFPNWIKMQTNFSYLDISNAEISDRIPVSLFNSFSSNIQFLNMSYNRLYGILPNLPEKVELLPEVDLSSNLLEGDVPSGFSNIFSLYLNKNKFSNANYILCPASPSMLSELDLSNNLFSGELPDCFTKLPLLSSLHLENNRFSGNVPESIGSLQNLQYLHLHNNSFSGNLPDSLKNCSNLVILNLGYNSFTGFIPPWIGDSYSRLGVLILRRNNIHGEIPLTLCQLSNLQILDLAKNSITGVIPNCVSNFSAMTSDTDLGMSFSYSGTGLGRVGISTGKETAIVSWKREEQLFKETVRFVKFIDLSYNELRFQIPDGISNLTGLVSLDLSNNKLSGKIISEIGQLTGLELLDLSNNHLTGDIPISLAKVSTLGILDLSNNDLSGEIPVSTQLQSFNASSYMGNPALCGAPLMKCASVMSEDDVRVEDENDGVGVFITGLYISVVLGFIVGFWGVCGTLVIKRSWRITYFRALDDIKTRLMKLLT